MSKITNMPTGTVAVAMVKRQVMIVQGSRHSLTHIYPQSYIASIAAVRHHTKHDKYIDVHAYAPFGERIFIASNVPDARIPASDVLAVIASPGQAEAVHPVAQGMLELSYRAFSDYMKLSISHQKKYERMWSAMTSH